MLFLEADPTAYLDEIQDFLLTNFNINVSLLIIHRVMKKLNKTHKKIERVYTKKDKKLRDLFTAKLVSY
jgi:hypothetical protein